MRALRYIALIAATQAALYSDETYDKLRRLFGRVSRQPASTSSSLDTHYQKVETALNEATRKRLDDLLKDTTTEKCREEVTSTFIDSYKRQISEDWLPFERTGYVSDCPSQRDNAPRAPRLRAEDIRLAYLLVVHETPQQITRLIEALEEGTRHNFIIHVDDKPQSQSTYNYLLNYASTRAHVHVLETGRQSVSWGGFNVVQATLNGLAYALDVLEGQFDWIITASGYTYPLASNRRIREELARHPSDTEFLEIRPQPNDPMPRAWHQFVECDGKMRRITRLLPPRKIKMYMGSQWMVVTRDFAAYATGRESPRQRRSFASQYAPYGKYTMVADENFFTTVSDAASVYAIVMHRLHLLMKWVVCSSILSRFGPRRGRRGVSESNTRSRRWRLHETAPPRRRRRDPTRGYVVLRTPSTRCHVGPRRATAMLRAGRRKKACLEHRSSLASPPTGRVERLRELC